MIATNWGSAARSALLLAALMGWATGVEAAQPGIVGFSRDGVDLTAPSTKPVRQDWRYGLGMPIQLDATTAGLLVNIRRNRTPMGDCEVGTDLIKFNSLGNISASNAVPISRASYEIHNGVASIVLKYPMLGGFVPLGARFANGSAQPYGGTGFGLSAVGFAPADFSAEASDFQMELSQFTYNGSTFTASQPVRSAKIAIGSTGWGITNIGLSPAIPDGNDLLYPVTAYNSSVGTGAGVARFQYLGPTTGWQPTSFVPVTDSSFAEPSLIRDVDGSLLLTARNNVGQVSGNWNATDIPLWRSTTGSDGTWNQSFLVPSVRQNDPLSLNQALDGTPYIATNTVPGSHRSFMEMLPVNSARSGLLSPITIRDANADFGELPDYSGEEAWMVDHPIGNVVRLADGEWHGILAYRVTSGWEQHGQPATPYTGYYVEEVFSAGDPRPMGFVFVPEPPSLVLALLAAASILAFVQLKRGLHPEPPAKNGLALSED